MNRPSKLRLAGLGLLLLGISFLLVGCGQSNAKLRVVNASPGETSLDVLLDGNTFASAVAYGTSTSYQSTSSGSRHLQLEPAGTANPVVDQTINLTSGTDTTLLAVNFSSNIAIVAFVDDNTAPASGNVEIRLINALPSVTSADVYLVPPSTDLFTAAPTVSGLAFESPSTYQSLTAGTYEVYVTLPGEKVAFLDSGPFTLSAGQIRTMVALDDLAGGFTFDTLSDLN